MSLRPLLLCAAAIPAMLAFSAPVSAAELKAVASFTVLADVVHQVGGDKVRVATLVGPDGDPHEIEPSPSDAKKLKEADVVFVSGEGLEGWMDRLISASGFKGKPVTASEGIKTRTMEEDGKTVTDPHVWNSPVNVKVWVANIEKALSAADPADAATFKANAEAYTKKLDAMDTYARDKIGKVPEDRRKVLTSHDAFGYFGREYKVTFLAPLGVLHRKRSLRHRRCQADRPDQGRTRKDLFLRELQRPRLVKQVAKATGAEPGGELYVESLSKPKGPAATYEKMFRYNVDQLAGAMSKAAEVFSGVSPLKVLPLTLTLSPLGGERACHVQRRNWWEAARHIPSPRLRGEGGGSRMRGFSQLPLPSHLQIKHQNPASPPSQAATIRSPTAMWSGWAR